MPAPSAPARASRLLGLAALLAGCAGAAAERPAPAARATTPATDPAPVAAPRLYEPAPLPRIRIGPDRSTWNPTRNAHGWPDRYGGEQPGGPYRPRL